MRLEIIYEVTISSLQYDRKKKCTPCGLKEQGKKNLDCYFSGVAKPEFHFIGMQNCWSGY